MADVPKETQEKINKLSMMEQQLQSFLSQKQTFQAQLMEVDSAIEELKKTDTAYKIVANIMVKTDKPDLEKDLAQKKEMVTLRLKSIEKQEETIRKQTKEIQEEVMKEMGK